MNSDNADSSQASLEDFDMKITVMGTTIARKGDFIYERSPDGQVRKQTINEFISSKANLKPEIERQICELEELILHQNPFNLIASIAFLNSANDPETYKEYKFERLLAYTEYLACLYLCKSEDTYSFDRYVERPCLSPFEVQSRIVNLLKDTVFLVEASRMKPDEDASKNMLQDLEVRALLGGLFVKKPSYPHHLTDLLKELWNPLENKMREQLGFSMADALKITETLSKLVQAEINERIKNISNLERSMKKAVKRYRQKGRTTSLYPTEILQQLSKRRPRESHQEVSGIAESFFLSSLGDIFLFSAAEISEKASISRTSTQAFLENMALAFGDIDSTHFRYPSATPPTSLKPFIKHDGLFFLVDINLLKESLRSGIESLINPDQKGAIVQNRSLWTAYEKARGDYLEDKACQYFQDMLNNVKVYRDLLYSTDYELDGLIEFDSALFLIEAKAGTMTASAHRGSSERIKSDLKKLVQEAYEQGVRAREYIESQDVAMFRQSDGTIVNIRRNDFQDIFLVNVTLDDLYSFVTNTYELREIGFFSDNDMPWSVSLTDLRIISELIEFPSQLVHYLKCRKKLNDLGSVSAMEELDWFGCYLERGLNFEDMIRDFPNMQVGLQTFTTAMDDYYLYSMGVRKTPATKPAQDMPNVFREMLYDLESSHPSGYLQLACVLLDLDREDRRYFAQMMRQQRQATLTDGELHDFTFPIPKTSCYITFIFASSSSFGLLAEELEFYSTVKKYQLKAEHWYSIGCIADSSGWVDMVLFQDSLWKHDEIIEKILAQSPYPNDDISE